MNKMKAIQLDYDEEIAIEKLLRATQPHGKVLQSLLIRIDNDLGLLSPRED